MVAGKKDNRVVQQPLLSQGADQHPQLMVDMGAQRVERAANRLQFAIAMRRWPMRANRGQRRRQFRIRPRSAERRIHVIDRIQPEVALQWNQRRVRVRVRDMPQPRLARVASLDQFGSFAGDPIGDVQPLRQVPRAVQVVVVVHAVEVLLPRGTLFGEKDVVVVHRAELRATLLGEHDVVEADAVALRIDMHLAHRIRLVAAVAKGLRQCGQIGHLEGRREIAVPMRGRVGAGHDGAARRNADRTFRVGAREARTEARQVVERRRQDRRVAGGAQQLSWPLIDKHEEHMRAPRHRPSSTSPIAEGCVK